MASSVNGQLESSKEAVKEQVNVILDIKTSAFRKEVKSLLESGHLEFTLG